MVNTLQWWGVYLPGCHLQRIHHLCNESRSSDLVHATRKELTANMSGYPRDYYPYTGARSSDRSLPPIRDVVGGESSMNTLIV